ncbi:MAG: ABC transporter ATP-binding protein [Litorivicinaceae bacterium]|nr:ABC transporter [Gammaproteobacteria bacterium]RPG22709.1 MAG: ABC transporter ATP-binding protein [Oceanospirillales bacterium TMED33]RZO75302.1 MAG: ABC transporter ATP-binding protein [Litorivicinaceae bacterium]
MSGSISVDYVSHQFSETAEAVLVDINLNVKAGELVSLIGRSGCGKSTLLHIMSGLVDPSEGCVRIDGKTVIKPSARWNMMFQKASLFPWMSIRENVALGLKFAGIGKKEISSKVDELLDLISLTEKADVKPRSLSGGQQQRVALARSLATSPTVLLLDEPFSALDTFTRSALQQDVATICRQKGITMVLVTHDIDEAVLMSDRVLVMDQNPGRIIDEIAVDLSWPRKHMNQDFQRVREKLLLAFKGTEKTEPPRTLDGGRHGVESSAA